jgi:hypothetical protein
MNQWIKTYFIRIWKNIPPKFDIFALRNIRTAIVFHGGLFEPPNLHCARADRKNGFSLLVFLDFTGKNNKIKSRNRNQTLYKY